MHTHSIACSIMTRIPRSAGCPESLVQLWPFWGSDYCLSVPVVGAAVDSMARTCTACWTACFASNARFIPDETLRQEVDVDPTNSLRPWLVQESSSVSSLPVWDFVGCPTSSAANFMPNLANSSDVPSLFACVTLQRRWLRPMSTLPHQTPQSYRSNDAIVPLTMSSSHARRSCSLTFLSWKRNTFVSLWRGNSYDLSLAKVDSSPPPLRTWDNFGYIFRYYYHYLI